MKRELKPLLRRAQWSPLPVSPQAHVTLFAPVAEAFVEHSGFRLRFVELSNGTRMLDPRGTVEIGK